MPPINWGHVSWANHTFARPERGWQKIHRTLERQKENVRAEEETEVTMRGFHCPALLLPVLVLWAVCSVSDAHADVRAVKLCGREFIRAVVYTCGGSRWRRFSSPQDMEGFFNGDLSSAEDLSESLGSDLGRRDLNHDCCQFGCKKSDLTLLC